MSAFSIQTMNLVAARSQGVCEVSGLPIERGHHHHRQPRGMGGTSDPAKDSAANCLHIHPMVHEMIEKERERALKNGWLVSQQGDPEQTPVWLAAHGGWCLLDPQGGVQALGILTTLA